jgi:hypothetical protein
MSSDWKKPKEKDPLDPQTVFTIKHSDIPKGVTQCQVHAWEKLNDNEIICRVCNTVNIVNPDYLKELLYAN